MNINEVKDLLHEFDASSLREFNWQSASDALSFSKNENKGVLSVLQPTNSESAVINPVSEQTTIQAETPSVSLEIEGEAIESPLVGVVYLKSSPDKPEFIKLGDKVKKGQTLLIIEAMKVMNEIPAPKDGIVTEICVSTEEVVEYGQALVRIK